MRADLAPFALDFLLGVAGTGILVAFRVVPVRASSMVAAFGLAYLTGAAIVPLVLTVLLVIGIPFNLATYAVVTLACIGIGLWFGRKRAGDRPPAPPPWWKQSWRTWSAEVWIVAAFVLFFGGFAVVGMLTAWRVPLIGWDAWGFYARKAQMLSAHDSLIPEFWGSPNYAFIHPDYPLQVPVFEALHFRAAGNFDTQAVDRHLWLLLVGFVWGAAYLLRDRVRPIVWAPLLLLAALAPGVWEQLLTGFADVPMAIFAGMGAIALALWLDQARGRERDPGERDPGERERGPGAGGGFLALAAVMLAAAANTKNEGLMVAVALLLVVGAIVLARRLRVRDFLLACGAVGVSVIPWHLWMSANEVKSDLPVSKGLDPGYMLGRTSRIWPSFRTLGHELADQGRWLYLLPLAILVVAAALISGTARRVAAFYAAAFLIVCAGFIWTYWLSPYPIGWHLETSAGRVITVLLFICIAAVVHVSGRLFESLGERRRPAAVEAEPPGEPVVSREPVATHD
jgi:hypothetical protein